MADQTQDTNLVRSTIYHIHNTQVYPYTFSSLYAIVYLQEKAKNKLKKAKQKADKRIPVFTLGEKTPALFLPP